MANDAECPVLTEHVENPEARTTETDRLCHALKLVSLAADVPYVGMLSGRKLILAGVAAVWLNCGSLTSTHELEIQRSNWSSAETPCANYDKLRNAVLGNIGVKIDVAGSWADGFRRALAFWNSVLLANFHEEADLGDCSIRIVNGASGLLNHAVVARSQITAWSNFRGKICVSAAAAKELNRAEIYGIAVHELGHMLGLKHNADIHSVMYFLNVDGSEVLDSEDLLDLSRKHALRSTQMQRTSSGVRASNELTRRLRH